MKRRTFLKDIALAATALTLPGCVGKENNAAESSGKKKIGEMTYRTTPTTGDKVSLLGYGCMRLPVIQSGDSDSKEDIIDQEEVNRQVDYALEHGVNYFDTSPAYCKGRSEGAMGIALSRHPRSSYFIATKLSNFSPATWSREASVNMFQNSLRELKTDYIDYLLLHGIGMGGMEAYDGRYVNNGMLDYLIEQREKGVIRNLGFSYHGDVAVFDHLLKLHDEGKVKWDFAQIQLNYIDWLHAKEINPRNTNADYLYNELHSRNIPAVVMEPLLGGRLASAENNVVTKMKQHRPDDSVASWAFRYAGTPEGILTVLSGMTYMAHLQENVETFSPLEPITDEENKFLRHVTDLILSFPTVPCTDCRYCMPCPYGVNIPAIFAHYNKCLNEGDVISDPGSSEYSKARKAYLVGYDRSVPRLRQASQCIGCHTCEPHCPQGIHIPERLHKIDNFVEELRKGGERPYSGKA